jgi:predicted deacylase
VSERPSNLPLDDERLIDAAWSDVSVEHVPVNGVLVNDATVNDASGSEVPVGGMPGKGATAAAAGEATAPARPFVLPVPELGAWRGGNTGVEGVWRFDSGRPGRQMVVAALVHGNELCGAWALLRLLDSGLRPRQGTLTLAFCNLAAFDRFDLQRPDASRFVDEDMNRVWGPGLLASATTPDAPRTRERERARRLLPFVEQADWLLDLHSMHEPGEPLLLTGLQPRNRALARELGTPRCVVSDAGHRDGQRMRDHGRFGVIEPHGADDRTRSLLIECGWHGDLASRDVAIDMAARFLVASGALLRADIPPAWWRERPAEQQFLRVTDAVVAATTDLHFAEPWVNGQRIAHAGTLLGWDGGRPIVTPADDCTIVMPSLRQLRVGVTVMRLARPLDDAPLMG